MTSCPYDGKCPHVDCLRQEMTRQNEEQKEAVLAIVKAISEMRKTLYIIVGILFAELGVMIL